MKKYALAPLLAIIAMQASAAWWQPVWSGRGSTQDMYEVFGRMNTNFLMLAQATNAESAIAATLLLVSNQFRLVSTAISQSLYAVAAGTSEYAALAGTASNANSADGAAEAGRLYQWTNGGEQVELYASDITNAAVLDALSKSIAYIDNATNNYLQMLAAGGLFVPYATAANYLNGWDGNGGQGIYGNDLTNAAVIDSVSQAKSYTDATSNALRTVINVSSNAVLTSAKSYTDSATNAVLIAAKAYTAASVSGSVAKTGDTMTGPLVLNEMIPSLSFVSTFGEETTNTFDFLESEMSYYINGVRSVLDLDVNYATAAGTSAYATAAGTVADLSNVSNIFATKADLADAAGVYKTWQFWPGSNSTIIAGAKSMRSISDGNPPAGTWTNTWISNTNGYYITFCSLPAGITSLKAGLYQVNATMWQTAQSSDSVSLSAEIYKRATNGVQTELTAVSGTSPQAIGATPLEYIYTLNVVSNYAMNATDSVLIKFKTSGMNGATLSAFISAGYFSAPIPSSQYILKSQFDAATNALASAVPSRLSYAAGTTNCYEVLNETNKVWFWTNGTTTNITTMRIAP